MIQHINPYNHEDMFFKQLEMAAIWAAMNGRKTDNHLHIEPAESKEIDYILMPGFCRLRHGFKFENGLVIYTTLSYKQECP